MTEQQRKDTKSYIENQMSAFELGSLGWIFWTWKTERGAPGWELAGLIGNQIFPQPLHNRWPSKCSI